MGDPSSMETTGGDGHYPMPCNRKCTTVSTSPLLPSGATLPEAANRNLNPHTILIPQPSGTKKTMGGPSTMETTHVEGCMWTHCHRSCTTVATSTPTPSGASLRKAAQEAHSSSHVLSLGSRWSPPPPQNFPPSHHTFSAKTPSSVCNQVACSAYLCHPKLKLTKRHSPKKYKKVQKVMARISLPLEKYSIAWIHNDLECYNLVIDGGTPWSAPLVPPPSPYLILGPGDVSLLT